MLNEIPCIPIGALFMIKLRHVTKLYRWVYKCMTGCQSTIDVTMWVGCQVICNLQSLLKTSEGDNSLYINI